MTEPLSRNDVIELLKKLGGERDEDVLEAARETHARITAAGMTWEELLVPEGGAGEPDDIDDADEFDDDDTGDDATGDDDDDATGATLPDDSYRRAAVAERYLAARHAARYSTPGRNDAADVCGTPW